MKFEKKMSKFPFVVYLPLCAVKTHYSNYDFSKTKIATKCETTTTRATAYGASYSRNKEKNCSQEKYKRILREQWTPRSNSDDNEKKKPLDMFWIR